MIMRDRQMNAVNFKEIDKRKIIDQFSISFYNYYK